MASLKIFNDPVYGFITIPEGILLDLVNHPYFQRLRRIMQLGFTHLIYPGAVHTRFHHALGALHLMNQALDTLRLKGIEISNEEYEAAQIAILLHDIGHGPFSHVLEHTLVPIDHEEITLMLMNRLNEEFSGKLNLAKIIFQNKYPRKFFNQLISSQLDVDRMDYLNRDSFYTGVAEGVIGYDRILKMLDVVDDQLVVEEKGLYSIEKYLIARRIMYWQVYMHKTAIAAETMLFAFLNKIKNNVYTTLNQPIKYFLSDIDPLENQIQFLDNYIKIDDSDIIGLLKANLDHPDGFTRKLASNIINRKLLKIKISENPFENEYLENLVVNCSRNLEWKEEDLRELIKRGALEVSIYSILDQEIYIKNKENMLKALSELLDLHCFSQTTLKYYITYPQF